MKQRIITGVISAAAFIAILFAMNTFIFPLVLSLLSVIAVFEIQKAIRMKNNAMKLLGLIVAAFLPLSIGFDWELPLMPILTIYIILTFLLMIVEYEKTKFEHAIFSIFSSLVIPYAFSVLILLRDVHVAFPDVYSKTEGIFFVMLGLFCAWLSDIFAFFAGSFFGKHKLAPKISPKKTVEGAVGGVLGTMLLNLTLLAVFKKFFFEETVISYWAIILVSIGLSLISICGDLTASILKRNYKIKDFGNLLPGHGGVMDRFDSFLFVIPVLYALIIIVNH